MRLVININCDNAAFDEDEGCPQEEIASILSNLTTKISSYEFPVAIGAQHPLLDSNGNKVGEARFVNSK